jgi:large subunit ribosomal protein L9
MRVILRENIENLGKKGDVVNVAPGYGRNYLLPKKMAIEVTSRNMKMIAIEQKALQKGFEKEKASYQEIIDRLNEVTLSFTRKTGEKDVIFGSVSSTDIRDALAAQGYDVEKKKILLDEPIKRLGNFTVPIKIFHEERAEVKFEVVKEGEPGISEDKEPKPDTVEEGAVPEPDEDKKELPLTDETQEDVAPPAEEKPSDVTPPAEEESPDLKPEVKEEPVSEPAAAESVVEEKKDISGDTEEITKGTEATLEAAEKIPEEGEGTPEDAVEGADEKGEIPEEQEKTSDEAEAAVATQADEDENELKREPSIKEIEESPLDTHEAPLDAQKMEPEESPVEAGESPESEKDIPEEEKKSPESTSTTSEKPEDEAEDKDNQEAASKDNK